MFANSPAIVEEISKVLGVQAGFMPTNTVRDSDFRPLFVRKIEKPVKILFCGRVVKEKGIEEIINAIKELNYNGIQASLEVVGGISDNYKIKLTDKITKLNLGSQIRFHGFIPFGDDLLQFYCDSDIYVLPSWHEGFPHSVWEAAATCTPVITTPVGGITGILGSDQVIFCKVKDSDGLANSILNCMTNLAATKSRINNLYHVALLFTAEKCAETTAKLLYETFR
jgi:glycosyltransferase involved in cell wall biosynthesis